jgi:hypothetical protein
VFVVWGGIEAQICLSNKEKKKELKFTWRQGSKGSTHRLIDSPQGAFRDFGVVGFACGGGRNQAHRKHLDACIHGLVVKWEIQ